ncbi:cell wall assembly regulator SMI1 [Metabacillus crassostreae]|uniref:SMI1/KNR4 family protein n=1 Tax=Metabacillus crassostreae TaxID=929098 RepID=UPI00195D778C|nr:SMI1/KNR4 family protein [Metabacillus crassostreae]MBM7602693.1 cell wall assembly regulator SMI1 [Metabacillus crassostreae]
MKDVRKLIHTRKLGVEESDINSTEEKLGAVFPEQYKELFKLVNHAEIGEWILYPIKDHRNTKKTWDDVVRQNTEVREENMSKDLIAIGDDGSGNKLCLKVNNGIMGNEIYLWYHEDTELEEYAPDLKEFIISISEEENDDFEDE